MKITVNNQTVDCMIDTGSEKTLMSYHLAKKLEVARQIEYSDTYSIASPPATISNGRNQTMGTLQLYIKFDSSRSMKPFRQEVTVIEMLNMPIIIGSECLLKHSNLNHEAITLQVNNQLKDVQIHTNNTSLSKATIGTAISTVKKIREQLTRVNTVTDESLSNSTTLDSALTAVAEMPTVYKSGQRVELVRPDSIIKRATVETSNDNMYKAHIQVQLDSHNEISQSLRVSKAVVRPFWPEIEEPLEPKRPSFAISPHSSDDELTNPFVMLEAAEMEATKYKQMQKSSVRMLNFKNTKIKALESREQDTTEQIAGLEKALAQIAAVAHQSLKDEKLPLLLFKIENQEFINVDSKYEVTKIKRNLVAENIILKGRCSIANKCVCTKCELQSSCSAIHQIATASLFETETDEFHSFKVLGIKNTNQTGMILLTSIQDTEADADLSSAVLNAVANKENSERQRKYKKTPLNKLFNTNEHNPTQSEECVARPLLAALNFVHGNESSLS